ncbi:hypothetical protein [Amycolatopsis sp. FDAARGOS 1241]|uniref:hypothetical protein n=1 Tax=Amycolatopsis sp. FDAARGOS 1241 TaxID=2778070 RepID=UPI001952186F|nr:hypothetical protein [Amycolatopsis sp. FDAARGOS 1241]QRP44042.1 hypothetical protein I6J71_32720 [Amycolatopsis sp. FDAARGOS 1241]
MRRRALAGSVVLVVVLGLVTAAAVPDPDSPREYLVGALGLLRAHSIDRDSVHWPAAEAGALRRAEGASTPAGTYSAIRGAFVRVGNKHAVLLGPAAAKAPAAERSKCRRAGPPATWLC